MSRCEIAWDQAPWWGMVQKKKKIGEQSELIIGELGKAPGLMWNIFAYNKILISWTCWKLEPKVNSLAYKIAFNFFLFSDFSNQVLCSLGWGGKGDRVPNHGSRAYFSSIMNHVYFLDHSFRCGIWYTL